MNSTRPSSSHSLLGSFLVTALAALAVILPGSLAAQEDERADEARERWIFDGEVTSVLSGGNSESLALGAGATARRRWDRDALRFEVAWVRVETGRITRRAVGTPADFTVDRDTNREKTAEAIKLRSRYDRRLSEHLFLYAGADWLRNTFAGIDSRTLLALGGGKTWVESDVSRFVTDFAVTYTFQEDVVENPFLDSDFAGLRVGWEYERSISASTDFESNLTADLNLQDTDDQRAEFINSITVDINDAIALKPSLELQWRNLPALTEVPLFTPGGVPTDTTVEAPLEELDYFFRLALVLSF